MSAAMPSDALTSARIASSISPIMHSVSDAAQRARPARGAPVGAAVDSSSGSQPAASAQMSPSRIAYATACERLRSCRRVVTSWSTFFTVRSEYESLVAI